MNMGMIIFITTSFGLLIGSFLNVVIYRLPRHQNLLLPRSHCRHCHHALAAWQNVPILSYFLLRGKCYYCHDKISHRYPAIELLTALLSGFLSWHFGFGFLLFGSLLFSWILLACMMIDLDHQILPDELTLPLLWLGLLFNLHHGFAALSDAVLGAAIGYLIFWAIYWIFKGFTGKEGLGYGDFKLLAALGAWLGWQQLPLVILLSALLGLLLALLFSIWKKTSLKQAVPFGPALAIAGCIALLWGQTWINGYLQWITPS